jgi:tRNA-2-methylthio-N6-dimethylallyladenosine synthase
MARAPVVDLVVGPQTYHRLPELIARARRAASVGDGPGRGAIDIDFPVETKFDHLPDQMAPQGVSAFLSVQEGCDKFCTFCVVPYTRGAEYSRPVDRIESEARRLVAAGAVEITLLGQNVNAYHGRDEQAGANVGLAALIRKLARVEGLARIRYTTSHPRDMDDDLIAAHGDEPKLMPFLHLPVQSGSNRILAAMNRQHSAADYLSLVERLRLSRPDLALSSDFIVGFPGESEADFARTLEMIEHIGFAQAYSFKYSPRPGTPGALLPDRVPEAVKEERLMRLQALLRDQQTRFNQSQRGRTLSVLFTGPGRHPGQLVGRSPYLQSVHASAPDRLIGQVVDVSILAVKPNSLAGRVVQADAAAERAIA